MPAPGLIPGAGGGFKLDFAAPTVSGSGPAGAGASFNTGVFGGEVRDVSQSQSSGLSPLIVLLLVVGGLFAINLATK